MSSVVLLAVVYMLFGSGMGSKVGWLCGMGLVVVSLSGMVLGILSSGKSMSSSVSCIVSIMWIQLFVMCCVSVLLPCGMCSAGAGINFFSLLPCMQPTLSFLASVFKK